ncbi:MAG: helix-turn-helix domain-containing protein [Eubacterium sp.]|nr:helix-turn-helix domain-containing protein [Eubacterium sp.]
MGSRSKKKKTKNKEIYDDIAFTYRKMDDAPYRLDAQDLRSMQKMEHALDFIIQKITDPELTLDNCAAVAGYDKEYFVRAFRSYFNMPFGRFVTRMRLHEAARDIRENNFPGAVGKKYSFANAQSFSKAFRNEFGISPRQFYKSNYPVPDMPFRNRIKGVEISMEYRRVNALRIRGQEIPAPQGDNTYFMDQSAFIFRSDFPKEEYPGLDLTADKEKVGIWWYEKEKSMEYVFGPVVERSSTPYLEPSAPEPDTPYYRNDKEITIQGGNYAVFSYRRPEDSSDINLMSRIMNRYIFKEWVPINRKVTNTMGFTYETFDSDRVSIYLPLSEGMGIDDAMKPQRWSIQAWSDYIDENITENLTLDSLAQVSGYSTENYRDVFSMYYGMTPSEYITKRRLLLAYSEMAAGAGQTETLSKYRFSSVPFYEKTFRSYFGKAPDEYAPEDTMLTDLMEYYEVNKKRVHVSYHNEPEMHVLTHSIEESEDRSVPNDIVGRMLYWFNRDFPDFAAIKTLFSQPEEKVFIWGDQAVYEEDQRLYKYYVGTVLKEALTEEQAEELEQMSGAHEEVIPGGRYAEFSVPEISEDELPDETVRLLTRCAFGGYINENRWRVDLKKRTFIAWRDRKPYFYVPVVR